MKVLMIGATGKFAGLVVPELKKKGVTVRALVQDDNKAAIAKKNGADETVLGNLEDEKSLLQAAKGMDGVFHINPAFLDEIKIGLTMVNAAKEAGVKNLFSQGCIIHRFPSLITQTSGRLKKPCINPEWTIQYCNRPCICRCLPEAGKRP
jgi:NmrA-like family